VIGATINWGIGRYLYHFKDHKRFPFNENDINKATALYSKYGVWTLLLAWAPIIGDPLTLIAGMFRIGPWIFLALVTIGKGGRYALILMIP
jgi:membrane protein YqaA with SNARE-associated domain